MDFAQKMLFAFAEFFCSAVFIYYAIKSKKKQKKKIDEFLDKNNENVQK